MPKKQKNKLPKRKRARSSSQIISGHQSSIEEGNPPYFIGSLRTLSRQIKSSGVQHVNSDSLKKKIRLFVKSYFEIVRIEMLQDNLEVAALDEQMQILLSLANARTRVSSYNDLLSSIERSLGALELQQMITKSNRLAQNSHTVTSMNIIGQDKKIIDVLSKILPTVALSYQQIIFDISQSRISYKGTAAEQREILREVLDYLAPDSEVMSALGFRLEKDRTTPTMKQKVRFILKNRNKSQSAIEVPENATSVVDESIAKLARATYNRGSLSTHTATEKTEVLNLKRYLDSVLCELLEIY